MKWYNISEILTSQIVLYIILIKMFQARPKKSFFLCPLLSILSIYILELIEYNDMFFLSFNIILYFIFPLLFVKNIKKSKIIYISVMSIGLSSLNNIVASFIEALINPSVSILNTFDITIHILFVLTFFLLSINKRFLNFLSSINAISKKIKILFIAFIWELLILIALLTVTLSEFPNTPILSLSCFAIVIMIVFSFLILTLLIANNLKSTYYKNVNITIQNSMEKQIAHYEQLTLCNENLRKFRHDFDNIKIGLNTYLQTNDTNGAIKYLNDCNMLIDTESTLFHTGHHIVDAIFTDKLQIAKDNNIDISFSGLIPSDVLPPVDLCIIFGNTLDNAIEACLKLDNNTLKNIEVSVKQNRDYIFITFTNPTVENIIIKNNTILTTKKDNEMHGIGLYSIKQVLKKYDGHLSLKCENNIFITEIDFCIPPK